MDFVKIKFNTKELCKHSIFASPILMIVMLISESTLFPKIKIEHVTGLGHLFFFDNYLVAEFNEGVTIDFENFSECQKLIKHHFGDNDFGFISNRIHSYALVLTDAHLFNKEFNNLVAYATVTYSAFAEKVFDVENHFFKFNKQNFRSLLEAVAWVEKTLGNNTHPTK